MRQPLKDRIRKAQKAVQIAAFIEKNKAAGRCTWCGEVHTWPMGEADSPVYRQN